ncbi:MAG: hypothetical protein ABJO67_12975 [Pseudoruegeria sp.]
MSALTDCHTQTVKAKNRTDHRHHAIDAAVVAARFVPPPRDGFRDDNEVAVCIPFALVTAAQLKVGGRSRWIHDPQLRYSLTVVTKNKEGKAFETTLIDFAAKVGPYKGLRRVRIVKPMHTSARVLVPARSPIKAYQAGNNRRFEVWRLPDGKIQHNVVSTFAPASRGQTPT